MATFKFTSSIPVYYCFSNSLPTPSSTTKYNLTLLEGDTLVWDTTDKTYSILIFAFKKTDTTTVPILKNYKSDGTLHSTVTVTDGKENVFNFGDGSYTIAYYQGYGRTGGVVSNNATNITVEATPVTPIQKYTVTTTLENATCNIASGTEYDEGTEITITVTADTGYWFTTAPTVDGVNMTRTSDTVYTKTVTVTSDVSVVASAVAIPETYTVNVDVSNATCNIDETTQYVMGEPLDIQVEASTGYYFATVPYIGYYIQGMYQALDFTTVQTTEYKTLYTCTVSGDITSQWNTVNGITIKAIGQVIPTPEIDKYGIITIYNPTSDELTNISKVRYKSIDGGTVDLGQFITRLHRLFVPVTTENKAVVMLGGYNTNVECGVIESDTITVSCGDITVNEVYENENDYKNTQCEIYLPFIGNNTVNTADIMNKVINLEYRINVITGDCLAILKAGDIVVNTFSGNCSFTIPYIMNEFSLVNKVDINAEYLNDFTPYLLIRRKDGVNNGISPIARKAPLNEFSGLIQVDTAFLQINAPRQEIDLLESVLQAGVIV